MALFGAVAAGTDVVGLVTFTEPAAATKVVVSDLSPATIYAVTTTTSGANHNVTVQPAASGFTTTSNGTLYVKIAAGGAVTSGT